MLECQRIQVMAVLITCYAYRVIAGPRLRASVCLEDLAVLHLRAALCITVLPVQDGVHACSDASRPAYSSYLRTIADVYLQVVHLERFLTLTPILQADGCPRLCVVCRQVDLEQWMVWAQARVMYRQ